MVLLLIPQRYEFSSKSQRHVAVKYITLVVADTTKVRIFKQITTSLVKYEAGSCCCWYHKGTNFQANHNHLDRIVTEKSVVADTTKVRIFKQITTLSRRGYDFVGCCWYHKGTNFQANHNLLVYLSNLLTVVADTTKVRIFKQITTTWRLYLYWI